MDEIEKEFMVAVGSGLASVTDEDIWESYGYWNEKARRRERSYLRYGRV